MSEPDSTIGAKRVLTFTLSRSVIERLDRRAEQERRSRSNLVDMLLDAALDPGSHSVRVGDLAGPAKPAPK